jgi:uroporphyrinogen III methyltransferase/synthase
LEFTAEALVGALTARVTLTGARVLLPRSEIGREVIRDGLRAAGAVVTEVIAYRTVAEAGDDAAPVQKLLTRGGLDAVTFTSGSAVGNFVHLHGPRGVELLRNTVVAVIGPVTADAARGLGIAVQVQPVTYTTAAMVAALAEYFVNST